MKEVFPRRFGPYVLVAPLGDGGMGEVCARGGRMPPPTMPPSRRRKLSGGSTLMRRGRGYAAPPHPEPATGWSSGRGPRSSLVTSDRRVSRVMTSARERAGLVPEALACTRPRCSPPVSGEGLVGRGIPIPRLPARRSRASVVLTRHGLTICWQSGSSDRARPGGGHAGGGSHPPCALTRHRLAISWRATSPYLPIWSAGWERGERQTPPERRGAVAGILGSSCGPGDR
jgi:hypothetical protein